jgi:hypothetical protein
LVELLKGFLILSPLVLVTIYLALMSVGLF